MVDGIAIRSCRVGLAATQFSVALCPTCYANRENWLGAFKALRFRSLFPTSSPREISTTSEQLHTEAPL